MRAEINNVIAMCLTCQQLKQRHIPRLGVAGIMPIPYQPREVMHIDHITSLPKSDEGYNELLAIKDKLSKQVLLEAAKSSNSAETTWSRVQKALDRTGRLPDIIVTDNGTKFRGEFLTASTKNGVRVIRTSTYHPNSNGEVEQSHGPTKNYLRSYSENCHWSDALDSCERAHNSAVNSATGFAPDDIVFFHPVINQYDPPAVQEAGRKERRRVTEVIYGEDAPGAMADARDGAVTKTEHIWCTVRRNLLKAAEKNEATYNATHTQQEFEISDYVWVTTTIRQHVGLKAMRPNWFGFYKVTEKRNQLYQVSAAPDQATILEGEWLNVDKLWPARVDSDHVAWMSMNEVPAATSGKLTKSSLLSRFSDMLESVD